MIDVRQADHHVVQEHLIASEHRLDDDLTRKILELAVVDVVISTDTVCVAAG